VAKKPHRPREQKQNPVVPIAIGLVLVSIAIIMLAMPNRESDAGSGNEQFSLAPLAVNFPAPDLSLENINGKTESLTDYRSNVVLVNNWATWCPPCKAEMPLLEEYYEDHAEEGFMIIAVEAGEAKESVAQFAQSHGLKFQVWLDPTTDSLKAFGNGNLPNSYVIDRSGTVRYAWTGQVNQAMLEKYITPLLKER